MEQSHSNTRFLPSTSLGSPLSLSSLVAATEGDHKRLMVEIPPENDSSINHRLTSSKRDDFRQALKYQQSMETTYSTPMNGRASTTSDDIGPKAQTFDLSPGASQTVDLEEFMDIISIKCRLCEDFVCSSKLQLASHIRRCHRSQGKDGGGNYVYDNVSSKYKGDASTTEEQKQLVSSLLQLANTSEPSPNPNKYENNEEETNLLSVAGNVVETRHRYRTYQNKVDTIPEHNVFPILYQSVPQHIIPTIQSGSSNGTVAINHRISSLETDSVSIGTAQPQSLSDFEQTLDHNEPKNKQNDIILCGVCSRVFSSTYECNHHILIVSNTILIKCRATFILYTCICVFILQ